MTRALHAPAFAPSTRHVCTASHQFKGARACGAFLSLLTALLVTSSAAAQPDETLLLRSCVSERGFRTDVDDCSAIAEIVRARMDRRGGTFAENLRALAPRLHGGTITERRWLLDLDVDCHRPRGIGATWESPRGSLPSRRDACLETVAEVRAILDGTLALHCERRPEHWGSRMDTERRRLAGYRWRDAVCPGATFANRFGFLSRPVPVDEE